MAETAVFVAALNQNIDGGRSEESKDVMAI
jgi:hypothetical protein